MPNYVRWRAAGATYFFTVVTSRRRRLFADAAARRLLRQAFVDTRRRWAFDMFAVVVLPDHLHCIWMLPPEDDDFPKRWSHLKRRFTQQFLAAGGHEIQVSGNRRRHRERGVWQARYWEHLVRDEQELYAYRDDVHLNPVKHGYVERPTDWPWSSVHRHLSQGWLTPDWTGWTPIEVPDIGE